MYKRQVYNSAVSVCEAVDEVALKLVNGFCLSLIHISREFWWQEGHTIHETAEEAKAETEQQLKCYADFFENVLAIPVVPGQKTEKEKFAGAEATYTVECMMKDHKALQGATSHYFGDKFSRAYNVTSVSYTHLDVYKRQGHDG